MNNQMNNQQLTTKEQMYLKDLKGHEELCIKKYNKSGNETKDTVLKQIFSTLSQSEQQHLNTINQIMTQGNSFQMQPSSGPNQATQLKTVDLKSSSSNQTDFDLVHDLLSTEKYVSSTYNTAVFEFNNTSIREQLNHIQKEEQEHGEILYNYLKQNGGYQAQA
jgi:spore coat protein CotF